MRLLRDPIFCPRGEMANTVDSNSTPSGYRFKSGRGHSMMNMNSAKRLVESRFLTRQRFLGVRFGGINMDRRYVQTIIPYKGLFLLDKMQRNSCVFINNGHVEIQTGPLTWERIND
jgi:hypothetical protein